MYNLISEQYIYNTAYPASVFYSWWGQHSPSDFGHLVGDTDTKRLQVRVFVEVCFLYLVIGLYWQANNCIALLYVVKSFGKLPKLIYLLEIMKILFYIKFANNSMYTKTSQNNCFSLHILEELYNTDNQIT
jgi:hypothetical protein